MTTPAEAVDPPDEHAGPYRRRRPPVQPGGRARPLGRPRQWIKNLLVFVAPAAAGVLFHRHVLLAQPSPPSGSSAWPPRAPTSSTTPSMPTSDRSHPTKRLRPVASGVVPVPLAVTLGIGLLVVVGRRWRGLLAGWHLALVMAVYAAGQRGLLPRAQARAHPRPGRRERRVRPAGHRRRRGHRRRPLQLVPHRGLLRLAARRDRQAVGREAAPGRARRPTTARSARRSVSTRRPSSARSGPCRPRSR